MKKFYSLFLLLFLVSNGYSFPADSLFQFEHKWTNSKGTQIEFKKLSNEKFKVLAMVYTSCPAACPLIIGDLKLLDSKLSKAQAKNIEYLIFSIDPNDTPEMLEKFYQKFNLDERWKLFRGEDQVIQELAVAIGYKYKKNGDGSYSHSTNLVLINGDGQIVKRVEFSNEAKTFKQAILPKKK